MFVQILDFPIHSIHFHFSLIPLSLYILYIFTSPSAQVREKSASLGRHSPPPPPPPKSPSRMTPAYVCSIVCLETSHSSNRSLHSVSPIPDSHALMTDTLSVDWNCLHAYAFPPKILIPSVHVLDKIQQSRNSSYSTSVASTSVVLSGVTTISISSIQLSTFSKTADTSKWNCRPRWLSWMCRRSGDLEVAGSTPAEVGKILSWRLIMKYFLWSFSPFR